jgi:hypothetical protein
LGRFLAETDLGVAPDLEPGESTSAVPVVTSEMICGVMGDSKARLITTQGYFAPELASQAAINLKERARYRGHCLMRNFMRWSLAGS